MSSSHEAPIVGSISVPLTNDHEKRPSYERSTSSGRLFYGPVQLLQDWDQVFTAEGASTQYFELFIDLLLVAAASSIADTFKEHHDVGQFLLAYVIILNGWFLYSHHITTRFEDSSFVHSMLLFLYMCGFGWTIVNVGDFVSPESSFIKEFAFGALIMRLSILLMLFTIAWTLPRARYFCMVLCWMIVPTMLALVYGGIMGSVVGLCVAAGIEFFGEVVFANFIDMPRFIPVNIEQSKERFGALGLIMLGETVVSVTQTYREFFRDDESPGDEEEHVIQTQYYIILVLSLLLIFMITLLIFHVTPEAHEHAIRRSKMHGVSLLLCHKILGLPLLAVGVSVKLVVGAVLEQKELSLFGYQCMSFGVGVSLTLIFFIRCLHFGGKTQLVIGHYMWTVGTNPFLDRITTLWWWTIGLSSQIPFFWYWLGVTIRDPLSATAYHAILLFAVCLIETSITHSIVGAYSPTSHGFGVSPNGIVGTLEENQTLL